VEVDPRELRKALLGKTHPGAIVYGHLLPHVLRKGEVSFVAVLRCEPKALRQRLAKRAYPRAKITENVEAELIGVVLDECVRRFGSEAVHEYDTTSVSPARVAASIAIDLESKARARTGWIDWTLGYDSSSRLRSLLEGTRAPPAST
jgi:adenylate kinase